MIAIPATPAIAPATAPFVVEAGGAEDTEDTEDEDTEDEDTEDEDTEDEDTKDVVPPGDGMVSYIDA